MSPQKKILSQHMYVSLTPEEYENVKTRVLNSTCRSTNEYLRKLVFGKKITVFYRNKSFDDFIEEAILLRRSLEDISGKIILNEAEREYFFRIVKEIKESINQLAEDVRKNKLY